MKLLRFRVRIALLSLFLSGFVLIVFGVGILRFLDKAGLERIDREIRTLAETQLRGDHPRSFWPEFDRSLQFLRGGDGGVPIAVRVQSADGQTLFTSSNCPPELAQLALPRPDRAGETDAPDEERGRPYPRDDFVARLDRDGNGLVSREEFDGPAERFPDHDTDGDGFISADEAPYGPPQRRGVPGGGFPGGEGSFRPRGPLGPPTVFGFETISTPAMDPWRVGIMGNRFVTMMVAMNLDSLRAETRQFREIFAIGTAAGLLVLACGSWWMASRVMRPVSVISRTASGITAGDLSTRIPEMQTDADLAELVTVINGMLDRIERGYRQAVRFSADAAHELQTPLTVLQGELDQAVQASELGSEEQQRYGLLLEEVRRLKSITQKLLLLARADAGGLKLMAASFDLRELVRSGAEDAEALAPAMIIETEAPTPVLVNGDRELLEQVVTNLITNAVKYNLPKGTLRLILGRHGDQVRLSVSNTGDAIPAADRDLIFERFHRVDKVRNREAGGTGLGLSLAREIARAHGGDLVLEPDHKGWTIFTLTLPAG